MKKLLRKLIIVTVKVKEDIKSFLKWECFHGIKLGMFFFLQICLMSMKFPCSPTHCVVIVSGMYF